MQRKNESDAVTGVILMMFVLLIIPLIVSVSCTKKPDGCPIPAYSVGENVIFDDVFIGIVLEREVVDCGVIHYKLQLNVEIDGEPWVIEEITEDRLKPYLPECNGKLP